MKAVINLFFFLLLLSMVINPFTLLFFFHLLYSSNTFNMENILYQFGYKTTVGNDWKPIWYSRLQNYSNLHCSFEKEYSTMFMLQALRKDTASNGNHKKNHNSLQCVQKTKLLATRFPLNKLYKTIEINCKEVSTCCSIGMH